MAGQKCPFCGCTEVVVSLARGETVCANPVCGEIIEEQGLVAETMFVERASGAKAMVGASVHMSGAVGVGGINTVSQELSLQKGFSKLNMIAERLALNDKIQEAGRRMYQLAFSMSFKGGGQKLVASACLYLVCRRNRSPHLLIDFSDVLRVPVKVIGRVYMKLIRRLVGGDPRSPFVGDVDVSQMLGPMVDPSIFIERFAKQLDLGPNQRKVQKTALRLIQYMHRDWICLGRRPNGLCGAALLVASYYHGINCPAQDIAKVVRMGEDTLRLRLAEMRETPLALMNKEDFEKGELPDVRPDQSLRALPPCMKRRLEVEAVQAQAALLDVERSKALEDGSPEEPRQEMPPPVGPPVWRQKRKAGALEDVATQSTAISYSPSSLSTQGSSGLPPASPVQSIMDGTSPVGLSGQSLKDAEKYTARTPSGSEIEEIARDIASQHGIEALLSSDTSLEEVAAASERMRKLEDRGDAGSATGSEPGEEADRRSDVALSSAPFDDGEGEVETLSDVDDEELEMYLLDAEEQQHKSDIWHEVNKGYLEEWHLRSQEMKRKKAEREKAASGSQPRTPVDTASESASTRGDIGSASASRSKGRSSRSRLGPASTCTQSAFMALTKRGKVKPNKINIDALESLFS